MFGQASPPVRHWDLMSLFSTTTNGNILRKLGIPFRGATAIRKKYFLREKNAYKWYKIFKEGLEDITDEARSIYHCTLINEEKRLRNV